MTAKVSINIALALLTALLENAGKISASIARARAAGHDDLPADDWNDIQERDALARQDLQEAIEDAT